MVKTDVTFTALFVAAVRARENERTNPLFRDKLSALLAGREGLEWLAASEAEPRSNYHRDSFPFLEVRTRFFDDWTLEVVRESKSSQLVILGAGMDTRAFRLPWPSDLRIWEIDSPELFSLKEKRLRSAGAMLALDRITVPADLESRDWVSKLVARGLDRRNPTVWLAEGLFQYLPAAVVGQILRGASSASSLGSRFGAEVISEDYLRSVSKQRALLRRKGKGTPWVFGTNDPEALFRSHGWHVDSKVGATEAAKAMKRWPSSRKNDSGPPDAAFVDARKSQTRRLIGKKK